MRRVTFCLLVTAVALVVAPVAALGKEGVKATLATNVPLDSEPGAQLRVAWTLTYLADDGQRQPFNASGVFVRLLSASGARAETGFAHGYGHPTGEYEASVLVPEGGIRDIEIGIRGVVSDAGGTTPSDLLFPITNDPVPRSARVASPPPAQPVPAREDGGSTAPIFAVVLASLLAMGALAVALRSSMARSAWSAARRGRPTAL